MISKVFEKNIIIKDIYRKVADVEQNILYL